MFDFLAQILGLLRVLYPSHPFLTGLLVGGLGGSAATVLLYRMKIRELSGLLEGARTRAAARASEVKKLSARCRRLEEELGKRDGEKGGAGLAAVPPEKIDPAGAAAISKYF